MNDEITPDARPEDGPDHHTESAARRSRRSTTTTAVSIGTAFALGFVGLGYAAVADPEATATAQVQSQGLTQSQAQAQPQWPGSDQPWDQAPSVPDVGQQDTSTATTDATAAQERGLVYINTVVDYGQGEGAGTGMVLTSSGTILTNHHVIEGATSISVEVLGTGRTYEADVVGYDDAADVAVLQLQGASGLDTVDLDSSADVEIGDEVTAVGNANGDGGAASASAGTVTALEQSITAQSESGGEQLTGLIEIDADVISGDSGGALYDKDGEVVAMTTAASSGTADITGYAVPIEDALAVVDQIESGEESGTVEVGSSGFLGVQLSPQSSQPVVVGTVEDSAAQQAAITEGSTITSFDGTAVTTAEDLQEAVAGHDAGDRVTIDWVDASGQQQSATVTLGSGPVG